MNNKTRLFTITVTLACFFSGSAFSAGFQSFEHSATGLGRAFAGEAALADNASTQFRNPAMLSYLSGTQISGGAIFVNPNLDAEGIATSASQEKFSTSSKDHVKSSVIPNIALSHQLDEKLYLGLALGSNFGINSTFDDNFKGIQFGNEAKINTLEINPNLAYRINKEISVGMGLRVVMGKVAIGSKSAGGSLPTGTTLKHFKGDDVALGWQLGGAWQIDAKNTIGFNYRSAVNFSLKGTATGNAFGSADPLSSAMNFALPASSEISSYHEIDEKIALHTSLNWTDWNTFKNSETHISSLTPSTYVIHQEIWMDTYRLSLGATYQYDKKTTLRTGIAYDLSAANDATRTLLFPESDRLWLSVGVGYHYSKNLTLDLGLSYIFIDDANLTTPLPCFEGQQEAINYGGSFSGQMSGNIWLMGLQASYRF